MVKTVKLFYENPFFENLKETEPFLKYLDKEAEQVRNSIKGGKILDLGCGNGRSTQIISEVSDNTLGIDFSERLIRQAKRKFIGKKNIFVCLRDAELMRFKENSFDSIVMLWNTFGNLYPSRDNILEKAKRILKKEGTIFISCFSENVLYPYFEMVKKNGLNVEKYDNDYVFLKEGLVSERFSMSKLERIFQNLGFSYNITPLTEVAWWCELKKE